jgi:hypothetical protein
MSKHDAAKWQRATNHYRELHILEERHYYAKFYFLNMTSRVPCFVNQYVQVGEKIKFVQ